MYPYQDSLDEYYQLQDAQYEEAENHCDNCNEPLEDFDTEERTCNQCAFESLEEGNNFHVIDSEFQITALPSTEMIAAANKVAIELFQGDSYMVGLKHLEGSDYGVSLKSNSYIPEMAILQQDDGIFFSIGFQRFQCHDIDHALRLVFAFHNKPQKTLQLAA
mgnify:CR=1 FL=1